MKANVIELQLMALFQAYVTHVPPLQHMEATPVDKRFNFNFFVHEETPIYSMYLDHNGQRIPITAEIDNQRDRRVTKVNIGLSGRIATFGELQDIVSSVAFEIYSVLK